MALTYALYELARHPAIQQRVVQEVDQFGREREPQYGDLAHFPLIDAVLKEGMRLHPPVTPLIALVNFTTLIPVMCAMFACHLLSIQYNWTSSCIGCCNQPALCQLLKPTGAWFVVASMSIMVGFKSLGSTP